MRVGRSKWVAVAAMVALLGGCIGGKDRVESGSRGARTSRSARPAVRTAAQKQCLATLTRKAVSYTPLPDRGGSCSVINSVKLLDFGTPTTNLGSMTCGLADTFVNWVRFGVVPAARIILHSEVVKINTFGTYNCRPIAGSSKLSEHGHANAIDISGFELADGRRITIEKDWHDRGAVGQFLQVVHKSACKRFGTILSPDYNSAHYNHFHLDMADNNHFCR